MTEETVAPFISHAATVPELPSRQRISPSPSRLRSPVPDTVQLGGTLPRLLLDETAKPFISHSARSPALSRHNRSALPSPSKSRWPTIDQPGTAPRLPALATCPPFISHSAVLPPLSRQAMSLVPSPLKLCVLVALRS